MRLDKNDSPAAFALTQPVVEASEQFLTLIAEKNSAQAYAATSELQSISIRVGNAS